MLFYLHWSWWKTSKRKNDNGILNQLPAIMRKAKRIFVIADFKDESPRSVHIQPRMWVKGLLRIGCDVHRFSYVPFFQFFCLFLIQRPHFQLRTPHSFLRMPHSQYETPHFPTGIVSFSVGNVLFTTGNAPFPVANASFITGNMPFLLASGSFST